MNRYEIAILALSVLLVGQWFLYFKRNILPLGNWYWRQGFRAAFEEWSNSNDWEGYPGIPATMYHDLVRRPEKVIESRGG